MSGPRFERGNGELAARRRAARRVSQPSDSSIHAALDPAAVGFLHFVAQPDGKHMFSETYADHLAAIRRARQRR